MRLSLKLTTLIYNKEVSVVRLLISAITSPFGALSADPSGNAMPPSGTKTFCACFAARTNQVFEIVPYRGHWPTPYGADHTIWSCDPRSPFGARVPYSACFASLTIQIHCKACLLRCAIQAKFFERLDSLRSHTSPSCKANAYSHSAMGVPLDRGYKPELWQSLTSAI